MKFKDFQAPVLFSSTFKAVNLGEKNSSTFKYFQGCVGTLYNIYTYTCFHKLVCKTDDFSPVQWTDSV